MLVRPNADGSLNCKPSRPELKAIATVVGMIDTMAKLSDMNDEEREQSVKLRAALCALKDI